MVRITWYGHACVGLEHAGRRLILDPYSPEIGLRPLHVAADLVAVSHDNSKWHSWLPAVVSPMVVFDGLELARDPVTALGLRLTALVVGEDADRGGQPNAMIACEVDGLRLVHFGDLGHAIAPREAGFLAGADVWFALAGGAPTIDLDELVAAWRELGPRVLIPIHYRTPSLQAFQPLGELLRRLPSEAVKRVGATSLEISREELPSEPEVWVLDPEGDVAATE